MRGHARAGAGLSLANDLRDIAAVAARIDEFCEAEGVAPEVAYAVNLALDELLSNTISHGYRDEEAHRIEVIIRIEGETLVVVTVDDGVAFDPTRVPEPDPTATLDEIEPDGLGLLLVNRMMDRVEYRRQGGCNVVILGKQLAKAAAEDADG